MHPGSTSAAYWLATLVVSLTAHLAFGRLQNTFLVGSMLSFPSALFAATAATPAPTAGLGASIAGFAPLVFIFLIFYFLVIRPQQKKLREHNKLLDSIKKGDKVIASGGLLGTVTKVDASNGHLHIEVATGVEVRVLKSSVSEVLNRDGNGKGAYVGKSQSTAKSLY